jgi:hypothetical protein
MEEIGSLRLFLLRDRMNIRKESRATFHATSSLTHGSDVYSSPSRSVSKFQMDFSVFSSSNAYAGLPTIVD